LVCSLQQTRAKVQVEFFAGQGLAASLSTAREATIARICTFDNADEKISRLATNIRGAVKLPMYVIDVLMDPRSSLGLPEQQQASSTNKLTWKRLHIIGIGI
jgi:hypothetical protein